MPEPESDATLERALEVPASRQSRCAFLKIAWTSGALSTIPMLLLYMCGSTIVAPYLPDMMTNFFAGQYAGSPVHCEDFTGSNQLPQECVHGSAANVMWSSYSSFFSQAVIAFMLCPLTGVWSDMMGRKPFLLLGQTLGLLPKFIILFYLTSGVSLYLYFPVAMLGDVVSTITTTLAMLSDCLPPEHRAAGFSMALGSLSLSFAIAPLGGQMLGLTGAVIVAVLLKALGLLYTLVCIKETVPAHIKAQAIERSAEFWHQQSERQNSCGGSSMLVRLWCALCKFIGKQPSIRALVQGFLIVVRNSEFIRLTAAQMGASFIMSGLIQVENQYLLVRFGFQQHDFAMVFVIAGMGMFLCQVLIMPVMLTVLRERPLIVAGFAGVFLKLIGLTLATSKLQVYASIICGTLYYMAYPSISSIKANAVPEHEQGAVQGALSGATALASGTGPLLFTVLYRWATLSLQMPQVVPAVCAALSLLPLALVCWLDLDRLHRWKLQQDNLQQLNRPLEEPLLAGSLGAEDAKQQQSRLQAVVKAASPETSSHEGVQQLHDNCLDGSALHRAGSSLRVG